MKKYKIPCDFCASEEYKFLIAGPDAHICETCIACSLVILREKKIDVEKIIREEFTEEVKK